MIENYKFVGFYKQFKKLYKNIPSKSRSIFDSLNQQLYSLEDKKLLINYLKNGYELERKDIFYFENLSVYLNDIINLKPIGYFKRFNKIYNNYTVIDFGKINKLCGDKSLLTDGVYVWSDVLAFFVDFYDLYPGYEFMLHLRKSNFNYTKTIEELSQISDLEIKEIFDYLGMYR